MLFKDAGTSFEKGPADNNNKMKDSSYVDNLKDLSADPIKS